MISIVIPAYNESAAIAGTIADLKTMLKDAGLVEAEIIIVDDGSTDGTGDKARAAGAFVVRNPHNVGYGWSLKRGIQAAHFDTIVITDADQTYPAAAIPGLLAEYNKGFDMVVGQRTGENYRESALKSPLRKVLRILVEFVAGRKIPDINSGLRVFDRSTALFFSPHLCSSFSFTTTLTLAYMMNGHFVTYCPIEYRERVGHTKVRLFRDAIRTLQYIVESIIYFNPMKAFIVLSSIIALCSAISFFIGAVTKFNILYYFGIGGVMISILSFCLGCLAVLLKQIMQQGNDRVRPAYLRSAGKRETPPPISG